MHEVQGSPLDHHRDGSSRIPAAQGDASTDTLSNLENCFAIDTQHALYVSQESITP